jgi:hypothetical protein
MKLLYRVALPRANIFARFSAVACHACRAFPSSALDARGEFVCRESCFFGFMM